MVYRWIVDDVPVYLKFALKGTHLFEIVVFARGSP